MAWLYLLAAGVFEIGWPLGLKLGWTDAGLRPVPLAAAVVAIIVSSVLLMVAQRSIPIGTAYAVWTGMGAVGTFLVGLWLFQEPATVTRCVCVGLIAAGVIGLRLGSS